MADAKHPRRDVALKAFMLFHERLGVGPAPLRDKPCLHESHKAVWLAAYRRAIEDAAAVVEQRIGSPGSVCRVADDVRALAPEQDDE